MRLIFVAAFLTCLFAAEAHASVNVVVNGSTYVIPQKNEKGWGDNVTTWIQAISGATLQPNGGTFTLTSDTYFGANFGLVSQYYKSPTTNIASTGILRLAKSDSIAFRNNANSSDLLLGINASDQLTFTGGIVATSSAGTFSDSGFAVYNNADNTKKLAIDASAITTGTTRTLKMANAAVDLANLNASTITSGTLPAAQLPNPSASTLGGVQSKAAVTSQWINSISTAGVPSLTQPAFSDISGTASLTTQVTGTLPIANGGTNNGSLSVAAGAVPYFDGTKMATLAPGTSGNVLTSGGTGAPTWTSPLVNPMTTGGDIIYGGAAGAANRLANGSSGQMLQSAGGTSAPTWAWPFGTQTTQTTTYSILATDNVVLLNANGAGFTATLPTAVGVTGKTYLLKKTDSTFNIATIATTSSQTIDGVVGSTLNTQNESLYIISDGSNWQTLERRIPSVWVSYTPTSSWVTNTTATGKWRRVGDSIEVQCQATLTGAPTAASLTFTIPSGLTIDTSKLTTSSVNGFTVGSGGGIHGGGSLTFVPTYNSTTTVLAEYVLNTSGASGVVNATAPFVWANTDIINLTFKVPITGWNG